MLKIDFHIWNQIVLEHVHLEDIMIVASFLQKM